MKIAKLSLGVGAVCAVMLAVGCGSKVSESTADSVTIKGVSLDERLSEKNKIDGRINQVQQGAEKIKSMIALFRKVKDPNATGDVYTPIDFLIDANKELKDRLPEKRGEALVRYGKITLPISTLSDECKTVSTLLESKVVYNTSSAAKQPIGEQLTYSLKTCGSKGEFAEAVIARWIGSELELKVINKNLETIVRTLLKKDLENNSTCKIAQSDKNILEAVTCRDFEVRLSASETAFFSQMLFRNSGEVRFDASAQLYENGVLKAQPHIQVFANGDANMDANKVGETAADSATAQDAATTSDLSEPQDSGAATTTGSETSSTTTVAK